VRLIAVDALASMPQRETCGMIGNHKRRQKRPCLFCHAPRKRPARPNWSGANG